MPSIVWKGQLTFGLVSVPVKLYRAARREQVRMHYLHRAEPEPELAPPPEEAPAAFPPPGTSRASAPEPEPQFRPAFDEPAEPSEPIPAPVSRVRQSLVTAVGDQPVKRADMLKGFEVEPDRYVVFDPGELTRLRRKTSATMEIVRSVRLAEIDPVFFETSYYVVPDRGGEKAYAILYAALQATDHVALARVGMHGREHIVIVRPGSHGMIAHTMFYTDEVRFDSEYRTDVESVGAKELELAKTFLHAVEGPFAPEEFKDEYRAELEALIEGKRAQAHISAGAQMPTAAPPIVDILEALKKSIAMAKKPAPPEPQPARKAPGKVTEIKSKRPSRKAR